MPKKARRSNRPEILNRTVDITSVDPRVRVGVDEPKVNPRLVAAVRKAFAE